jgi:putative flippase GtrA
MKLSIILKNIKQLITYFIVGIITSIFNYVSYLIILLSFSKPLVAGLCGFFVGLIPNFFLNKKFTFNSVVNFKSGFLYYLAIQMFVLAIQLLTLKVFILLLFDVRIAQIPAILVSGILNYILLKIYIFKK